MDLWSVIGFLALVFLCSYLVLYYASPHVSLAVKVTSILTWVLNFGLVLLVPSDIFMVLDSFGPHTKEVTPQMLKGQQKFDQLIGEYMLLYWTVYILTWTIIPVLQEWENSGDLSSTDRLKRSLKVNGVFYLYMLIGAVVSLGVLVWLDLSGDMGLITYLKALASTFGIFLEMVLMGYAMVEVPKTHWRTGDLVQEVKYLKFRISQTEDSLNEAHEQLQEISCHIYKLQESSNNQVPEQHSQIQTYIDISLAQIPEKVKSKISKRYKQILTELNDDGYPVSAESAIELHRGTKRCQMRIHRESELLESLVRRAILAEDICSSQDNVDKKLITKVIKTGPFSWHWYCKVKPVLKRALGLVLGLASVILLISETQVFFGRYTLISFISYLKSLISIRITVLLVLLYITYMVNYSLFRLKLSNLYGLYKRSSDGPSLMFATVNFSRVSVATIVNFFDMLKMGSVFTYIMGGNKLGLLGDWVMKGMPGVLWLIVLMHFFGGWSRVMKLVGLEQWGFKRWEGEDTVSHILKSRRQALEKQLGF